MSSRAVLSALLLICFLPSSSKGRSPARIHSSCPDLPTRSAASTTVLLSRGLSILERPRTPYRISADPAAWCRASLT